MTQESYAQRIRYSFREHGSRSYHALFPLVASLRTQDDTRGFMEGYLEVMKSWLQEGRIRGPVVFDGSVLWERNGGWSLEDSAIYLARDNLPMLASVYEANTNRKPQRSWFKVLDQAFPTQA